MFCPNCGKMVEEGSLFCQYCGTRIGETLQTPLFTIQRVKKPMGVMFIVFFTIFMGFSILLGGMILSISSFAGHIGFGIIREIPYIGPQAGWIGEWILFFLGIAGLFFLFLGIFYFTAAYGLWNLAEWGRRLASVLYIIAIPLSLLELIGLRVTFRLIILELMWISVLVIILFYLSKPDIKRLFQ